MGRHKGQHRRQHPCRQRHNQGYSRSRLPDLQFAKLGSEGGTFTVRYTPTIIRSAYLKPTLTLTASNAKSDPATFFLIWDGTQSTTGVDSIEADVAADDIWYNLQGVRIDTENLTPGLYIRVRAGKSTKVMLR